MSNLLLILSEAKDLLDWSGSWTMMVGGQRGRSLALLGMRILFFSRLLTLDSRLHLMKPHSPRLAPLCSRVDLEVCEQRRRFLLEHSETAHRHPANLQLGPFAQA